MRNKQRNSSSNIIPLTNSQTRKSSNSEDSQKDMRLHIFQSHRIVNLFKIIQIYWSRQTFKFRCLNQTSLRSIMFFSFLLIDIFECREALENLELKKRTWDLFANSYSGGVSNKERVFERLLFRPLLSMYSKNMSILGSLFPTFVFYFFGFFLILFFFCFFVVFLFVFNSKERWLDIFSKDYSSSA